MKRMNWSHVVKKYRFLFRIIFIGLLLSLSSLVIAHEQWFLTASQMQALMNQPRPEIFIHLNTTNVCILLFVLISIYMLLRLERGSAKEFFPEHQVRLASKEHFVPLFLRVTTGLMLLMAAFGLNPRLGAELFMEPTLIFPDLQLDLIPAYWSWLKTAEIVIAMGLILGVYVRLLAILLLMMGILGVFLFKIGMVAYIGFLGGVSLYLFFQGPGMWFIPLPPFPGTKKIIHGLQNQAPYQAQFMLRVLTGLDFALTGFICKFLYPNLAIGLLTMKHMPTFGLEIETVVFWMAIIETFSGLLLMFGVLTRPVSFALMVCFFFMAFAINEPLYSHMIFYGVLIACYINGAGQSRRSFAKDKPANIVILGANLSGIYCAMTLENLLKKNSNVQVTIVHNENYFQFGPLLSDVISGLVHPDNIINPIRNICSRHRVIQGMVKEINPEEQTIKLFLLTNEDYTLHYDQLIITHEVLEYLAIPGLKENSMPIFSINDALYVRKHILNCLEKAAFISNKQDRKHLLTFSVIGGGLRAASVATEIQALIKAALAFYSSLSFEEVRIILCDQHAEIFSTFDQKLTGILHKNLIKMGIEVCSNINIHDISFSNLTLSDDKKVMSGTIINAAANVKNLMTVNESFQTNHYENIFSASISAHIANHIPFQALYETKLGQAVAYNAWAYSQGYTLRKWKQKNNFFYVACLGRYASIAKIGNVVFTGWTAWVLSRLICLLIMPGLEKNLRVMTNWMLNIPFRRNLCVFPANLSADAPYTYEVNIDPLPLNVTERPKQ